LLCLALDEDLHANVGVTFSDGVPENRITRSCGPQRSRPIAGDVRTERASTLQRQQVRLTAKPVTRDSGVFVHRASADAVGFLARSGKPDLVLTGGAIVFPAGKSTPLYSPEEM
jgi:hypothetical protein